ncbi:YlbL family protein [Marinactinospora thermotolerans]|uniref:PDZ domain-containing protein n=1 Tax=Marinactinospora thermotolerans DSM 45154 TaxID=1122192 RepID=A0A1T4SCN3_9ACTN|nr:PDZ domain-containing protein [Marinactinospora thermotolerans]SKA25917.1 PDZ domain-containing protein [Marinactinospora thermotolerans DSM 45154]
MLRRARTLIVALLLLVALAVGASLLPVPYLVASPGVALNTLGEHEGEEVIRIEGRRSYDHEGGLAMVTVQYAGGPGARMDLFTALGAWLSPTNAVLPEEAVFPPDRSLDEITESQSMQMDDSQQAAVAAALTELGIDYDTSAIVAGVNEGGPAEGRVEVGDVIAKVDGEPVSDKEEAVELVRDREVGDEVALTVERDGRTREVTVTSTESEEGEPLIGVMVGNDMDFPVEVDISVGDIGGPSAGMMFALGIMDRLSPEGLTGGHVIAGSGTITPEGEVGGVSGVQQKMVSAQRQGAEYFFVAAESCSQTLDSAATGEIEVVRIERLSEAVDALEAIRTGEGLQDLPRCE